METIEVASRSFVIKWITAPEGSIISYTVHPLKKSINVGIFEKTANGSNTNLQVEIEDDGNSLSRKSSSSSNNYPNSIEKRLESSGLSPVLPIKKCNANEKSDGQYEVPRSKGGIYALVFDNTFSKTTPKTVHFTCQAQESRHTPNTGGAPTLVSDSVVSGTLLKKRRKKLQGYTRRYFVLDLKSAILNYYTDPKSNSLRGSLPLHLCAISASKAQRVIFVDSGMEVWNLKALKDEDWQVWVDTFEKIRKGKGGTPAEEPLSSNSGSTDQMQNIFSQLVAKLRETKDISDSAAQQPDASDVTKDINSRLAALYLEFSSVVSNNDAGAMTRRSSFNGSIVSDLDMFYDAEEHPDGVVFLDDDEDGMVTPEEENVEHSATDEEEDDDEETQIAPGVLDSDDSTDDLYPLHDVKPVKYRTTLPDSVSTPPSMFGILKKSVGKDMGSMAVPITTNEPISALQRFAEMFEYPQLLDEAEKVPSDDGERIIYIATWAVSYLALMRSKERALRKPFNPLLGETYELVRPDLGYRLISEKVCHHPPKMAIHVDSDKGWTVAQSSEPVQKFWGKSMEINYLGPLVVRFRESGEIFHWNIPTTYLRNIMAGEKYVEPVGDMTIFSSNGQKAIVEFKAGGMFSGRSEEVNIKAVSANGSNLPCFASGKWTEQITLNNSKGEKKVIWKVGNLVNNHTKKWGFTEFAAALNEVTPIEDGHASPYDSRFRPDQKDYEQGNTDQAEATKKELEEKQRQRRKVLQEKGETYKPNFFEMSSFEGVSPTDGDVYRLCKGANNYWNRRKEGNWDGLTPLW